MSEPVDERARLYRAGEARRPVDDRGGRVLSEPGRTLVLSFPVRGFSWLRSDDGDEFEPDTLEVTYEWWGEWLLCEVELSGSDPRCRPSRDLTVTVRDLAAPGLPGWAAGFVAGLDPAKLAAP